VGIIIKQAIRSTVFSYVGAGLGFLTVWFMNRLWLTPEQNGLLNVIISISLISSSLSNLGMAGVVLRLFPHFRNPETKHSGFLFYPLSFTAIGSLIFLGVYFLLKDDFMARNAGQSPLLAENLYYLLPLTFFLGVFNVLDAFTRALFLSTAGVIIKEVALRIIILVAAACYLYHFINFEQFVLIYFGSFCAMALENTKFNAFTRDEKGNARCRHLLRYNGTKRYDDFFHRQSNRKRLPWTSSSRCIFHRNVFRQYDSNSRALRNSHYRFCCGRILEIQ